MFLNLPQVFSALNFVIFLTKSFQYSLLKIQLTGEQTLNCFKTHLQTKKSITNKLQLE